MKRHLLVLLSLIGALPRASSIEVRTKNLDLEVERLRVVLMELEAAYNWHTQPKTSSSDIVRVARLMKTLDYYQYLDKLAKSNSLLWILFYAVENYMDDSPGLSSSERCDEECTANVIEEFMNKRHRLASSLADYKNMTRSYADRLMDSLLGKPGADLLSESLIHMAFAEYHWIDSAPFIDKNNALQSDLSLIDTSTFYKNRRPGRAIGAMLRTYKEMKHLDKFGDYFKEEFYRMLHLNGFGVYDHVLMNVESISTLGKFV